jgi:hypothetical protein
VAIPFQVYDMTGSTLLVGLLGLVALVALLTVPLIAGAIADAVDVAQMLVTVGLLVNALLPDPNVSALFAAEALGTAAYAFQRPARNALTPRLVPLDQLTAAIAVADLVPRVPLGEDADRPRLRSIVEGFRYVRRSRRCSGSFSWTRTR